MIDISKAFCLSFNGSVVYDGRAYSTLETGDYLVIRKLDGSFLIHNSCLSQPVNYQGPKSKLVIEDNKLKCMNKKEIIVISINSIHFCSYIHNWSNHKISIRKTEKELVQKIINNWETIIGNRPNTLIEEYKTDHGLIDIVGLYNNHTIIIEVKRKKATLEHCYQLQRYIETFTDKVIGYIASPDISSNAKQWLSNNSYQYVKVDFDYL